MHPTIFGLCYRIADTVAEVLKLRDHGRSELLLVAPKTLQAIFAAVADFYTWKLASYIYGVDSMASLIALALTVVNPWQGFCSTRTFSNSLEMTLTVVAMHDWPWHWALPHSGNGEDSNFDAQKLRIRDDSRSGKGMTDEVTRLRRALLCAAMATILRPTNILVWVILTHLTFIRGWVSIGPSRAERVVFVRETLLCGSTILALSTIIDRFFYKSWVFPPFNFLYVNVVQSLATFYGNNDWHYYISQGYPLLLTTALPFTLIGLFRALGSGNSSIVATAPGRKALRLLSIVCLLVPAAFSNIAHKEVRFIYPLLPALHIVSALPIAIFFGPLMTKSPSPRIAKQLLLLVILGLNLSITYYICQIHNSGIINLTHYLRHEFESAYLPSLPSANMTVGMLMPCHSTPWRSHLQYPPSHTHTGIHAWALTCEPPLHLNSTEKSRYLDEADQFYANPSLWLKKHMSRHPPARKDGTRATGSAAGVFAPDARPKPASTIRSEISDRAREAHFWTTRQGRRPWPDYLVFFAQLEPTMHVALRGSAYVQCTRLFNSRWHDDWRRWGDVVVWCLDAGRMDDKDRRGRRPGNAMAINAVEEAIHDAGSVDEGAGGQKILGGKKTGGRDKDKEPLRRVVEKPFWKVRAGEQADV